jgi:hypothetical protein
MKPAIKHLILKSLVLKSLVLTSLLFAAAIWIAAIAVAAPSPAHAQLANKTPLAFGMNVEQASAALGVTLIYVRGSPGNEIFLALSNVKGSALSDRRDGLYLQFRHGKLDGWKGDWGTNRPCCE